MDEAFPRSSRFQLQRRLGSGGMGVVYQAWDGERSAAVALKTLLNADAAAIYRLKREFRALADVAHPGLVALHELFSEGERWFFTMELVDGVDFLSWVRPGARARAEPTGPVGAEAAAPRGALDEARLRESLRQLCEAVAALHAAGRLHRDLKPSNVLVQRDGTLKVLDFGLAVDLEPHAERSTEQVIVGTPSYMAPEQAAMEPAGPAADWYAVGVMLYEALSGKPPFSGSPLQILMDKQRVSPPPLQAPHRDLCELCMELLARHPEGRPESAEILRRLGGAAAHASLPSFGFTLVGQKPVLAALQDAFADVRKGSAATVLLHGNPGVGTTTVARTFADAARRESGAVVLSGRCYERESVPFKALDSLVDALSRYLVRLPRLEAEALLPRDVRALSRMFPVLRRVEAVASAPQGGPQTPDLQELRKRAASALRELLWRIADRKPLILLIDGLQWSDPDSAALLAELLRFPDAPAMLLVACCRESPQAVTPLQEVRAQLAAVCPVRELEVQPLSAAEAGELAALLLERARLPAAHAAEVARESNGSPFFVHELVRALQIGAGRGVTLDDAIRARARQLPLPAQRLLETVAVSGGPTLPSVAAHAAELEGDSRSVFSLLRAAHLLRTSGDGERVETWHDRIREAVLSAMAAARLGEVHLRLAAALESAPGERDYAALALHLRDGGRPEQAAEYAALAGARAAEALAFEQAARLLRLALDLRAPDATWGRDVDARLGDALANAGLGEEAARAYLAAASRPWATSAGAIELRRMAAEQYLRSGHIDEGLEVLRPVLANHNMHVPTTPRSALATLLLRRARIALRGTRFVARDSTQLSAEQLARIDVCWTAAVGLGMVDTIRGAAFQAKHLLLALEAGEPMRIARAFAAEAPFVATGGSARSQRTAQRLVEEARKLAQQIDIPHVTALAAFAAAVIDFLAGRWRSCREHADEAAALFRDRCTGVAWELSNSQLFSLWSLFYLGELGELRRRVQALLREARARGDLYAATSFRTGLNTVALLVGDDVAGARREVDEVLSRWSQQGFHFQHYWVLLAQGVTDLYAGDGAAAYARMEEMWPRLQASLMLRIQNVLIEGTNLRARAALTALRLDEVEKHAQRLSRVPVPWSQALAVLLRAGLAAARGEREAAALIFEDAAGKFEALEMALFACAARRRSAALLGDSALVAACDAQMSAQGIKNPLRMTSLLTP